MTRRLSPPNPAAIPGGPAHTRQEAPRTRTQRDPNEVLGTFCRRTSADQDLAALTTLVRDLIDEGAKPAMTGGMGAVALACSAENDLMVRALAAAGVNLDDGGRDAPLRLTIYWGRPAMTRLLLGLGARADFPDGADSPLHDAAITGNPEVVADLLAAGARLDSRGEDGDTPLLRCLRRLPRGLTTAGALIRAGADVNAPNPIGDRPLHLLLRNFSHSGADVQEVLALLLARGADLDAANRLGEVPRRQMLANALLADSPVLRAHLAGEVARAAISGLAPGGLSP